MDPTRFDRITKLFAARRLSRRQALATGGAGLAAGIAGAVGRATTTAQDATPAATPAAADAAPSFLFVQTFGAGSLAPKTGEEGMLTLTADHLAGQTVYLSDRPERIVGMVPTEHFLGTGGSGAAATPEAAGGFFTPSDPPNAALVFASTEGDDAPGDVLVLELIDPTYDPATGTATYDVRVLADEAAVDLTLLQEPVAVTEAPRQFEAASLFIDDCPDVSIICYLDEGSNSTMVGTYTAGQCWDYGDACCSLCNDALDQGCVDNFPNDCVPGENTCVGEWTCTAFTCKSGC